MISLPFLLSLVQGDFFGSTCPKDHFRTVFRVFQLRYLIFVSQAHKMLCKKITLGIIRLTRDHLKKLGEDESLPLSRISVSIKITTEIGELYNTNDSILSNFFERSLGVGPCFL